MKRLITSTALALLLATPGLARDSYALLVGASHYDNLDPNNWLKGPPNDIRLVETYLESNDVLRFAADHVTVLADGVDEAQGRPTLAAIRTAFAALTAKVQPGDFVYLHFSGHGSQAPAMDLSSEWTGWTSCPCLPTSATGRIPPARWRMRWSTTRSGR